MWFKCDVCRKFRKFKCKREKLPDGTVQKVVDEGRQGDVRRQGERRLLFIHLDVVEKSEEVDHAVAEERQQLKFRRRAFGVDGQVVDERLEAARGSKVLKERPKRCQQNVLKLKRIFIN
jgi:hypothetical protein